MVLFIFYLLGLILDVLTYIWEIIEENAVYVGNKVKTWYTASIPEVASEEVAVVPVIVAVPRVFAPAPIVDSAAIAPAAPGPVASAPPAEVIIEMHSLKPQLMPNIVKILQGEIEEITVDDLPERFCLFRDTETTQEKFIFALVREVRGDQVVVELSDAETKVLLLSNVKLDVVPPDNILSRFGYPSHAEIISARVASNPVQYKVPETISRSHEINLNLYSEKDRAVFNSYLG